MHSGHVRAKRGAMIMAAAGLLAIGWSAPAWGLDDAHAAKARAAADKAIAFLRANQGDDGSWSPRVGPAITALAAAGMLRDANIGPDDPAVARALAYIIARQKDDGGIYDQILPNYNTAISLMALGQVAGDPTIQPVIQRAQQHLIDAQWKPGMTDPNGNPITADHPYYGGAGYGSHGRPDMSNTTMMLEGLYDSGFDCTDPAFKRALAFVESCQGVASNKRFGDRIVQNGGFIYANSVNKDNIGTVESRANPEQIDRVRSGEAMTVERVRPYGAMTYAGFKSYVYAQLQRDDPRVVAARDWIANNYDLSHNVGMPSENRMQGYFYYLYVFGRAMSAWGEPTLTVAGPARGAVVTAPASAPAGEVVKAIERLKADGIERVTLRTGDVATVQVAIERTTRQADWANDLVDALVATQKPDGSWTNPADRYMEGDANLVTAYCLNALQMALASR